MNSFLIPTQARTKETFCTGPNLAYHLPIHKREFLLKLVRNAEDGSKGCMKRRNDCDAKRGDIGPWNSYFWRISQAFSKRELVPTPCETPSDAGPMVVDFYDGLFGTGGITGSPVISFVVLSGLVAEVSEAGAGCAAEVSVIDGTETSSFSGSALLSPSG